MDKTFDPRRLDIRAFAQAGAHLQGLSPLAQWPRLLHERMDSGAMADPHVRWDLRGTLMEVSGEAPRIGLVLMAQVDLPMQCQRCLGPVLEPVRAERVFVFVADEATAEALDEDSEEDVLVISRDFDALSLVEDELILALPLVPRHEVCPQALPVPMADEELAADEPRPHPFAGLAVLKKGA